MLVLLVDADRVVVDDAQSLEDGSPPPTLTFQGHDVEGPGGRLQPGPDLVYRLAGRANVVNAYGRDIVESPLTPSSHLDELRALPVYVDTASINTDELIARSSPAGRGEHPSGQRPHLRLAPPVVVDPAAGTVDGVTAEALRAEAERARAEAERVRDTDAPAAELLDTAAAGYEQMARELTDGGDPFCLWCARENLPSPHGHESDDHPAAAGQ